MARTSLGVMFLLTLHPNPWMIRVGWVAPFVMITYQFFLFHRLESPTVAKRTMEYTTAGLLIVLLCT